MKHKWRSKAACTGVPLEVFFPETGNYATAKEICKSCSVQTECLEMSLSFPEDEYGMFGGATPRQRSNMRWERMWTK